MTDLLKMLDEADADSASRLWEKLINQRPRTRSEVIAARMEAVVAAERQRDAAYCAYKTGEAAFNHAAVVAHGLGLAIYEAWHGIGGIHPTGEIWPDAAREAPDDKAKILERLREVHGRFDQARTELRAARRRLDARYRDLGRAVAS